MSTPLCSPLALRIVGTGEYLPERIRHSSEFDRRWGKPDGWTFHHSGVMSRHVADAHETSSYMGAMAARRALAVAGLAQTDCLISACSVMEQPIPCLGALLQRELGWGNSGIPAFDVNATCLSFLVALDIAAMAVAANRYRRILIVASEVPSCGLNLENTETAPLFGDGAVAVIVEAGDGGGGSWLLGSRLETYGDGAEHCRVRAGGTRLRVEDDIEAFVQGAHFEMDGRMVYRQAAQLLPGFLQRLFAGAGMGIDAMQWLVPHQASGKALEHVQKSLCLPAGRMVHILRNHGNQLSASIPAGLHHLIQDGCLRRGDHVALLGTGAGLALGGAILRY
ncbi:MAG: ketoacyl-ACP synthase III [Xanthomonadaceae bacterium]|jgi:3-oxoacyl-[acyl-carrier-protein] synthase-3|nr:ketoacyl-ACP synthase III [Xanthomonadaceae bacterium]